ncbi:fimbrial protein [Leclercia adecarboxylata]|uniref:fimbrial protein n=1 Tax=Leclercia adecarboxylata TaxID=83655 RepID=UPI00384BFBB8
MKVNLLNSSFIVLFVSLGNMNLASAANNEVTFIGTVLDTACTVTVNNGNSTVDLGGTLKSDLSQQGDTGAPKKFSILLSACPAEGPTTAWIKFTGQTDGNDGWFKNTATASAATNVAVMIKQGETIVEANDGNDAIAIPATGGDVNVDYTAQLVATAAGATKGTVSSTLTYNVSYQ